MRSHDGLLFRENSLVNDYNWLLEDIREVRTAFRRAQEDAEDARDEFVNAGRDLLRSERAVADILSCIQGLRRFDDPMICLQ